jgi:hypothetical protein
MADTCTTSKLRGLSIDDQEEIHSHITGMSGQTWLAFWHVNEHKQERREARVVGSDYCLRAGPPEFIMRPSAPPTLLDFELVYVCACGGCDFKLVFNLHI